MSKSMTGIGMGLLVGFIVSSTSGQVIRYVDDDVRPGGDGRSWKRAYHDLQDALDEARQPDSDITEIRVAEGVYKPDRGTGDKELSFELVGGVSIYGGFAGLSESLFDLRDPEAYQTIITGDLEGNDDPDDVFGGTLADNSFQLLLAIEQNEETILDGLVMKSHHSYASNIRITRSATIWRNCRFEASGSIICLEATPIFEDCEFSNNIDNALFLIGSDVTLVRCIFRNNGQLCFLTGGAIKAIEQSTLVARECKFIENGGDGITPTCGNGGAIYCTEASPASFSDCEFISNFGSDGGGAIFMDASPLTVDRCLFLNNRAKGGGGAIYASGGSSLVATNSQFIGNTVGDGPGFVPQFGGGAIGGYKINLELSGCRFQDNSSEFGRGGGVMLSGSNVDVDASIVDCEFVGNKVLVSVNGLKSHDTFQGGGLSITDANISILRSSFIDNHAAGSGGGIWIDTVQNPFENGPVEISGCLFQGNQALLSGGGLMLGTGNLGNNFSPLLLSKCQFIDNEAGRDGGGFVESTRSSSIASFGFEASTFRGNTAGRNGGAIAIPRGDLSLINCLLNDNSSLNLGGAMYSGLNSSGVKAINCTITGNHAVAGGGFTMNGGRPVRPLQTVIHNSIFWNNSDDGDNIEESQFLTLTGVFQKDITHSTIQGLTGSLGGIDNIGDDPLFVDADGADNVPGTEDDDFHLSEGSTSIDTGDNDSIILEGITTDLDGNERIINAIVDRGAFEFLGSNCPADIAPPEGNGMVNVSDLLQLLAMWGSPDTAFDLAPPGGDGDVNVSDLLFVLANWGDCPE